MATAFDPQKVYLRFKLFVDDEMVSDEPASIANAQEVARRQYLLAMDAIEADKRVKVVVCDPDLGDQPVFMFVPERTDI